MEAFSKAIEWVNGVIWHPVMLVFLGFAGLWFTIHLKGMQFSHIKYMFRYLFEKGDNKKDTGMSSFQAFATTVGGRIGTGNIAGTATAIFMGGPGAIFWMWIATLVSASTGMVECMLGQAFKTRNLGELTGGPYYYMSKGLKNNTLGKILAALFCVAVFIGPGFLLPAMQTQTTATALKNAFGLPFIVTGIGMVVLVGVVILGGIKVVGSVAEKLAPVMCAIYLLVALIILGANITRVPGMFASIFTSAFGADAMFGGILGACIQWGIKRGMFSNDAGNGMSPIISATSDTSHPVKQGLVQGLSVYIDTLLVCTCTGLSILLAGTFNVAADQVGDVLIVENAPGVEYGVSFMQAAMSTVLGNVGAILLAILLAIFIYTTQLSYSVQLESMSRYLFKGSKKAIMIFRILFLCFCMFGTLVDGEIIWPMGDIGVGCMMWVNTFSVLLLTPVALRIVKDYKKQREAGLDPLFDPATVGIDDETGVWDVYVQKKISRGDYENEALGYNVNPKH